MWKFITSAIDKKQWLDCKNSFQVCFWGRSNVGKSSLLNAITNQNISFVSKHPGRTQLINYFADNNDKYIVDLPGYGYAEISKEKIIKMNLAVKDFLKNEPSPKHIFLLIDSRTRFTKNDLETLTFLNSLNWNYDIVYTKIDKLNQKEKSALIKKHNELNSKIFKKSAQVFLVSSQKNINLDDIVQHIEKLLYNE
ncbi:ribosome biogenesis GTP-binding protein YihA/YsxC [Mycoplasmopsis fermentans]|uniref:ribosome biogenesis GTP-binding protein YihA/YsxC n=1 Tax=Mycoplasmopsis fermentans TaxID=2115 RepID=UPI0001E32FC9|nr:ribosome biogenesis GTP-binding protein YihA/YsxC [Mycoplasmopsis fermentans]ADN68783.1 GTP-binding protein [Mycoplasmopsis fermentans JER]RMX36089.1 ribosome biogenesis GTP-binding protein YsxC [Mycoplasmopsis fermentans MF-I2]RMX36183.1 ribosome biogenesis GTP-binding protein YsxC [Mycoplasmopsis fermentans MF-I1]